VTQNRQNQSVAPCPKDLFAHFAPLGWGGESNAQSGPGSPGYETVPSWSPGAPMAWQGPR